MGSDYSSNPIHFARTRRETELDAPPSGAGLKTEIATVRSPNIPTICSGPGAMNRFGVARASTFAGTLARSLRGLTKVVGTEIPSTRAVEFPTNPTPSIVKSNAADPS